MNTKHTLSLAMLMIATACQDTPRTESVEVIDEQIVTADVTAIDAALRLVTLETEDGENVVVAAGPEVRNFDQIDVGDAVRVRYRECIVAAITKPDEQVQPTEEVVAAGRSPAGAKPGAAVGHAVSMRVKIQSVDTERNIVVFTLPNGDMRAAPVRKPDAQEFLHGLKPGDSVQIDYAESLAITVEKIDS